MLHTKLIGIGNAGCTVVKNLTQNALSSLSYTLVSNDEKFLAKYKDSEKLLISEKNILSKDNEISRAEIEKIKSLFGNAKSVILFAQFDDDKSVIAAPILAKSAGNTNLVAICSIAKKPSEFCKTAFLKLKNSCKSLIAFPNSLSVGEIFMQENILKAFEFEQTKAPEIKPVPAKPKSLFDRLKPDRKTASNSNVDANDLFQNEFSFVTLAEQRGFFEDTDRNFYNGEDLDVPTYLRKNIKIIL